MPEPTWQEVLDGAMAAREPRATRRSIAVNYPPDLFPLVLEAARRRGISMAAFQRRAALAFAIHDAGADYEQVMAGEPAFGTFERPGKAEEHGGKGFGPWKIEVVTDA